MYHLPAYDIASEFVQSDPLRMHELARAAEYESLSSEHVGRFAVLGRVQTQGLFLGRGA